MSSRRILIVGLSSDLGGRLAQTLERHSEVESVVGIDTEDPRHEFQRTEFVRVGTEPEVLRRILDAAAIDTVVIVRRDGVEGIRDACGGRAGTVRKVIFKSSAHWYGWGSGDPAFFTEDMSRRRKPGTEIEREVIAAESAVTELAHYGATVTILRTADEIGSDQRLTLLGLPVVPSILGFDPRFQFVHEDDVVGALAFAARHELPGVYNVAGDGVLVLSEVVSLLGKTMLPILPPWGTAFAAVQLRRLGFKVPLEAIRQLRYGRGLDNRRLKAAGFAYRYTSREALLELRARQRLRPLLKSGADSYRYQPELEEFLRWSPSVQSAERAQAGDVTPPGGYDRLTDGEVIDLISSLEPEALATLRSYEASHQARGTVLAALDRTLARKRAN